ncbi:class A beta-lactamase [Fibrella sp. HMF5036]|uniref:Beta-lactamase n=2 Tax=Fibrella aquatilis TaxID=2817059 RepID=A0A939G717_9BACT|nr:class A beta-lactamase [Fibrella aquatilis]
MAQQPTTAPTRAASLHTLRQQLNGLTQPAQGRVGMAALVLETGDTLSIRGNERFPMQSVYKFPIGMAVLHQVDQGKLSLNQLIHVDKGEYVGSKQHSPIRDSLPGGIDIRIGDLLRYAVSQSDGSASDVLMRLVGGPTAIMAYLKSLNINSIRVLNTEKELGRDNTVQYVNWATPTGMVGLLKAVQQGRGLSPASRALLLRLMTETPTGPNRLKSLLPPGTVVAHKTGSSGTVANLTAATNDVGLITLPNGHHLALAVFVSDSKAAPPTREAVIANMAKVVWEHCR